MRKSLSARLLTFSAIATALALLATAILLKILFQSYFQERIESELEVFLGQLADRTSLNVSGEVNVTPLSDPRFEKPLSGYYWQVDLAGQEPLLSPSSWSGPIQVAQPGLLGEITFQSSETSQGDRVLAANWVVTFDDGGENRSVDMVVAIDQAQIDASVTGFTSNLAISMAVLCVFLLFASWMQVRVGLKPLEKLRSEVACVAKTRRGRISIDHPQEVLPLVHGMNNLLDAQDRTLERARAGAGDLAHGLKTPLTVLVGISRKLAEIERPDISSEIDMQIDTMQHFVERELAKARDGGPVEATCKAAPVVARLVSSFRHRADAEGIIWKIDVDDDAICPFDEYALIEVLGNLVDNAMKWTKDSVSINIAGTSGAGVIRVLDNGVGIREPDLPTARHRGVRLDEHSEGYGLGLAIVEDMAQQRNAELVLRNRSEGGLVAEISWE